MIGFSGVTAMVTSSCGGVVLVVVLDVLVDVVVGVGVVVLVELVVDVDEEVVLGGTVVAVEVVDGSVVLVVVEVGTIGGSVVPVGRVLLVVEVSPVPAIASNVRGLCALALILTVAVRQSGAISTLNRTFRAAPQEGQRPLIFVPRLVAFTRARRAAQAPTISTRRPVTAIVSTRAPAWSMSAAPGTT